MSRNYKIQDNEKAYFITFTVINWIDVFIRNEYRNVFIDSLKYCQEHKGLNIYAWCLMTSHAHLIVSSNAGLPLAGIIRDTKSYTSRHIRKLLENKDAVGESRRECLPVSQTGMFWMMQRAGKRNANNTDFQFWQQHNQPIVLDNNFMIDQKVEYIHNNPVEAGFVDKPEDWKYSSAIDFTINGKGLLDLAYV
ncbi:MAG: transposase [Bacteroidetes bacterium]|jgi:putative transposase|nr:transposase [Bacteroidota bacterium]